MKIKTSDSAHSVTPFCLTRRALLKTIPALAIAPALFAQVNPDPLAVRKLHSFGIRVTDVDRSVEFYQTLFGAPIQARQGDTVCLRIGDGPRFFSISPVQNSEQPSITHIGLSIAEFDVDAVIGQLTEFGFSRATMPAPGQDRLTMAMRYWINERGLTAGGSSYGSRDLYFADIEGVVYHLSSEDHCGGGGALGNVCDTVEPAPTSGMLRLVDLSHFTNFMANSNRANTFFIRAFGKQFQVYQGAAPVIGVGDGIQFLMYVGGNQHGPPTNPGNINHVCFSVENFGVDDILAQLTDYGLSARENSGNTQPMMHWVSMRLPNRGGAEGGTPELYFSDPDGLSIQLQDPGYCGGGGYLGNSCPPL